MYVLYLPSKAGLSGTRHLNAPLLNESGLLLLKL